MDAPRPVVLFSRCLGFARCRYDGGPLPPGPRLVELLGHVTARTVCPEVDLGMPVPRPPIRLAAGRLVQPSTGRDLTASMEALAAHVAGHLAEVDGLLLKSRSPSCGLVDTHRYDSLHALQPVGLGAGLFAAHVVALLPELPALDERRLEEDPAAAGRFLDRVWARASARLGPRQRLSRPPLRR